MVYEPGAATAAHVYDLTNTADGTGAGTLVPGGLAVTPDESHLFAVVATSTGGYALRDLNDVKPSSTTLTVDAPATADRAKELTVTGTPASTAAFPTGATLTVTRTDVESPAGKGPVLKTTMTYYEGRKQRLQLQAYYQGAWHDAGSEYHDTSSGDNVNTTTYGAWKYFIFTN